MADSGTQNTRIRFRIAGVQRSSRAGRSSLQSSNQSVSGKVVRPQRTALRRIDNSGRGTVSKF